MEILQFVFCSAFAQFCVSVITVSRNTRLQFKPLCTQEDLYSGGLWADGFCPTNSHADPAQAGPTVIGENGLEELDTTNTDCLPPQLLAVTTVLEV